MLDLNYLSGLARMHGGPLQQPMTRAMTLRGASFSPWPEVSIMGVVNLSPGSWYRESVATGVEAAVRRGRRLAVEGARIIDIGAESTLSHTARVDAATQRSNLVPVVRELSADGILVSVETYHADVTKACLQAGAAVVNLTAGADTEPFYRMVAEHEAGIIICYVQNGKHVRDVGDFLMTGDHTQALYDYFARETELAASLGVERMWIDPGLGFYYQNLNDSKSRIRYQLETFLNSFRLHALGWPVCHALPHAFECFEEEVRSAEPFFAVMALLGQADLLRTHEVAKVRGVIEAMKMIS
ncbi:dihydropteroate synthase [Candidatus Methylospira mobilis]|uniref:Dihydropteroate synthase n=1 Tax=Candidatus Methylospira mobilis TaxID=1808979 RepID=A0A5Q0BMA8_9GAMM|nr:dihydropteroate synthase [Candidatus Methylospira mobilis]QFY43354.1 dihydropteroate synthase [Candidatus Methylospira mobilis]WNV03428.1 dihydropteroate synthase [Candidatus Methylospira mobilis]